MCTSQDIAEMNAIMTITQLPTSVTVMNTATQLITIIPSCVTITHAEGKRDSHGDEDRGGDQHRLCLRWTTAACWKR